MTTEDLKTLTWQDVVSAEVGHIFLDRFEDGIRFLIMRGPVALCAYLGLPEAHPLSGHNYDDLPINAHGGLTFSGKGGNGWPEGYCWYGWDYAHCDDFCVYDENSTFKKDSKDKKWTPADVEQDSWSAIYDFKRLVRLSEAIARKGWAK